MNDRSNLPIIRKSHDYSPGVSVSLKSENVILGEDLHSRTRKYVVVDVDVNAGPDLKIRR